jgi:MFS family permease
MIAAFMTLVVSLTSSIYSGAIGSIQVTFPGYSIDTYISPLSTFVLGFAIGPLLWAPLSEVFGRRNIFIVTYACFTIFNAGLCASQNIWTIAILRFFSGAFGSSPLTNAGGVISDIWDPEALGEAMAIFSVAPYLGPAMGEWC